MKKQLWPGWWYRNWIIHNLISHPLSEIVFLFTINFSKEKAHEWFDKIHDWSLPPKDYPKRKKR